MGVLASRSTAHSSPGSLPERPTIHLSSRPSEVMMSHLARDSEAASSAGNRRHGKDWRQSLPVQRRPRSRAGAGGLFRAPDATPRPLPPEWPPCARGPSGHRSIVWSCLDDRGRWPAVPSGWAPCDVSRTTNHSRERTVCPASHSDCQRTTRPHTRVPPEFHCAAMSSRDVGAPWRRFCCRAAFHLGLAFLPNLGSFRGRITSVPELGRTNPATRDVHPSIRY